MRKSIFFAGLAAIAAFSFSSCSKNEVDNPDLQETFTHTVTIKLDAPETRTEIVEGADEASFKWSESDAGRFVVKENETSGDKISLNSTDGYVTATLGAEFETETAEEYVYTANLSNTRTNGGYPKIPDEQEPTAASYDPNADILVAQSQTFSTPQDKLTMKFYRPVVINKMTLKGITAGETVSTVEIKGDVNITGWYNPETNEWSGQKTTITTTIGRKVSETGEIVVWFVTMPVDGVTLTVTAITEENSYSKTFARTIDFKEGQVTEFGVSNLTQEKLPTTFTVGENTSEETYEIASFFPSTKNGIRFTTDATGKFYPQFRLYANKTITIDAGETAISKIEIVFENSTSNTGPLTVEEGTYSLPEGSATGIWTTGEGSITSVTFTADAQARFKSINVYTEDLGTLPVVESTPELTFAESVEVPFGTTKSIAATTNSNLSTITYSSDDEDVASVDAEGNVTGEAQGSATITASIAAVSTDYYVINAVSKECEVTVTAPADFDILNYDATGLSSTGYQNWTADGSYSDAVYAGNSNGLSSQPYFIQLRNGSGSGIVSTTSGGALTNVKVSWNTSTSSGRTITIYGSNQPFTGTADLYDDSFPKTALGDITYGTSTELSEIEGTYEYVGIVAKGALYLDEIDITWDNLPDRVSAPTNVAAEVSGTSINVTWTDVASGVDSYIVTCTGQAFQTISQGTQTAVFSDLPNDTYSVTVQAVPASEGNAASEILTVSNLVVSGAATEVWKQTALADITADDVFVIVGKSGDNYYSMSNNNGTSSAPTATAVTVVTNDDGTFLSGNVNNDVKWNLSSTTANDVTSYTFYPNGSTTTWLYCSTTANSSSNNNMRIGTGNRKLFIVSDGLFVTNDSYTARYISLYNATDWRGYVASSSGTALLFFVLQDN